MNLKSVVPAAIFAVSSVLGTVFLPTNAQAQSQDDQTQAVSYECYDANGNIAFTTINPQETYGWTLGCRPLRQLTSTDATQSSVPYYQCYDANGNVAFTTTDSEAGCPRVGSKRSNPIQANAIYYECYNNKGEVAFTTRDPQDTFGWLPSCREVQYRGTDTVSQTSMLPYECYDTNGGVAFTTRNPQIYQSRGFRCQAPRQVK
jgi:hypothetical protein